MHAEATRGIPGVAGLARAHVHTVHSATLRSHRGTLVVLQNNSIVPDASSCFLNFTCKSIPAPIKLQKVS